MFPWFLWKGIDSRTMGVWVSELPPPTRASERVEQVEIPGRPGTLTLKEGENVHEGYVKECTVTVPSDADFESLLDWLTGDGEAIFSNEPSRVYFAHMAAEVKFTRISNSLKTAKLAFYVHPHKGQYPPEPNITLSASGSVYNPGKVTAKPFYTVTFTSTCSLAIDGETMTFTAPTQTEIYLAAYEREKTTTTIGNVMDAIYGVGNVDLLDRPEVSSSDMTTAGWEVEDGEVSTVYSVEYYVGSSLPAGQTADFADNNRNLIIHITPIKGTASSYEVKTDEQLRAYVQTLLSESTVAAILNADKVANGGWGVLLWVQEVANWVDDEGVAEKYDEQLHYLQAAYYLDEMDDLPSTYDMREMNTSTNPDDDQPSSTEMTVIADCDAELTLQDGEIWNGTTNNAFPKIPVGTHTVTPTDCTVVITPRWRWF